MPAWNRNSPSSEADALVRRPMGTSLLLLRSIGPLQAADPVFPYGAVYFRKSNPPEEDWAKDHQNAARIGMNTFRHWFMWSAIEVAPGKYDWRDYDRMMDLPAKNGIKVVIAGLITAPPQWAFHKYPPPRHHAHTDTPTSNTTPRTT